MRERGSGGLKYWLVGLAAMILAGCGDDGGTHAPPDDPLPGELQDLLDAAVGARIPGVALCVRGPEVDFIGSSGLADLDAGTACRTDHLFQVASVGKSLVGVTAARLIHSGVLAADSTLTSWLPPTVTSRLPSSDRITLTHLLTHTSGLVDFANESEAFFTALTADPDRVWADYEALSYVFDLPLHTAPGSAYRYSNTNYLLVGMIIEAATGTHYSAAVRELVLDPLGMDRTTTGHREPLRGEPAHGYLFDDEGVTDATPWALNWEFACGGQWSTVEDLSVFLRGFLHSDTIASDELRAMVLPNGITREYGLGIAVMATPYGPAFGHDGLLAGYATYMFEFQEYETSVVLCANRQAFDPEDTQVAALFMEVCAAIFESQQR